jgi:hypothetical protein
MRSQNLHCLLLLMNAPVILQAPYSKHLVKYQDVYSKLAQAAHLKQEHQFITVSYPIHQRKCQTMSVNMFIHTSLLFKITVHLDVKWAQTNQTPTQLQSITPKGRLETRLRVKLRFITCRSKVTDESLSFYFTDCPYMSILELHFKQCH